MRDEDIRSRLNRQMETVRMPQDLRRRTMERIEGKETIKMKRKRTLVPVMVGLMLVLLTCTALATGFLWDHPLQNELEITDELRNAYRETDLMEQPGLTAEKNGVTVTLGECIADEHTAYISFIVSGFQLPEGCDPAFAAAELTSDLHDYAAIGGSFLSVISEADQTESFLDSEGRLTYVFIVSSPDGSLIGRDVHVELGGLGVYTNDVPKKIEPQTDDVWTFDWTIKGTDQAVDYRDIELPVGDSGWILTSARITPLTVSVTMKNENGTVTSAPVLAEESNMIYSEPYFAGFGLSGERELYLAGMNGGTDYGEAIRQYVSLSRVIDVNTVDALIFMLPGQEETAWVELPMHDTDNQ